MKTLKNWSLTSQKNNLIELLVDEKHTFSLYVLEADLFRVLVKKNDQLELDRTWCIANHQGDTPWEGRDRLSVDGFTLPNYQVEQSLNLLQISTDKLRVKIHQPLWLEWEFLNEQGEWQFLTADRPTGSYMLNHQGDGVAHYQRRFHDDQVYGLGDKAGDLNRNARRFEMRNLDAMGYNAEETDPLYKHIPFTITRRNGVSFGLFYDNLSSTWLDLGKELDNYHLPYRRYQAEAGDLDYYLFLGPQVLEVTKKFIQLTGKTIFGPKWSLGYSGSTMSYTDAPDAQDQLLKFITLCEEHDIPCDSFQLSSGYTSIANKRYVFNWNHKKFPDPKGLFKQFHQAGLKLAANIKPCLLQDHPKYDDVAAKQLFIKDSETLSPERSVFWDDEGSHLDFTNPDTINWWKSNVKTQLLEMGIDSTWNDNNEFEIWDKEAVCHGFGNNIAIKHIRPVMPLLMCRASLEAQQQFEPEKRPYLISRSGCAGIQRYVQTWSGDNRTNWNTLRYNIRMGLGMSLSGLYNLGHDVGGFSGEKPDAELFVRWVQNGVMHPRFTIHSWNDDHTANEPWMHPEVTDMIRDAINLRYKLMPYFYNLLWLAHQEDEPMLRPIFLDYEHDAKTFVETDDFFIGKDLLVASVVEQGQRERSVYLPKNEEGWYCFYSGSWFAGGQSITLPATLDRLPLLVRAGAMLPMSTQTVSTQRCKESIRELHLFPIIGDGVANGSLFEDDGESFEYLNNKALWLNWKVISADKHLEIFIDKIGDYVPDWTTLRVIVPSCEQREVFINGEKTDLISFDML